MHQHYVMKKTLMKRIFAGKVTWKQKVYRRKCTMLWIFNTVYSEGRNICLMAKERKLKNLKVLDLKNICTNLSLTTTGNKQRKIELVNSCSCSNLL